MSLTSSKALCTIYSSSNLCMSHWHKDRLHHEHCAVVLLIILKPILMLFQISVKILYCSTLKTRRCYKKHLLPKLNLYFMMFQEKMAAKCYEKLTAACKCIRIHLLCTWHIFHKMMVWISLCSIYNCIYTQFKKHY